MCHTSNSPKDPFVPGCCLLSSSPLGMSSVALPEPGRVLPTLLHPFLNPSASTHTHTLLADLFPHLDP